MQTISALHVPRLDPSRIASISGAILVNGLLVLLLVAPMSMPVIQREPETVPIDWVLKEPPPEVEPPEIVEVTKHRTAQPQPPQPAVRQVEQARQPDPVTEPVDADYRVDPPVEAAVVVDNAGTVGPPDDGTPVQGAHLEYATAPPPPYPRADMAAGNTGTVLLEVLVDIDGRPIEVKVARSSGHRSLDVAAKRQVLSQWRFRPAMRNGRAVQAIGLVPVEFKLDD